MSEELVNSLPFALSGYRFLRCVGQGSCATVFEVFSERYGRNFAAKMTHVDESLIDSDGNIKDPEIGALFTLDNPYIIRFYDYFMYQDYLFLVLEFCSNGTLQQLLKKISIPFTIARQMVIELISALDYCHNQNIAHRDIKPSNVFIDTRMHVKLADFDLSSFCADLVTTKCGSPNYAAPEVFSQKEIDPYKADVFSLGVTCFEICTGELPWPEGDIEKESEVKFPASMDPIMAEFIGEMLHRKPESRPTMRELMETAKWNWTTETGVPRRHQTLIQRASMPVKDQFKKATEPRLPLSMFGESQPQLLKCAARRLMTTKQSFTDVRKRGKLTRSMMTFDTGHKKCEDASATNDSES